MNLKFYIRSLVTTWTTQPSVQAASLVVLVATFFIMSTSLLIYQNISGALNHVGEDVKVNVFLKDEITESEKNQVRSVIENSNIFKSPQFITKDEALSNFKLTMKDYAPGLLADLEFDNPLPSSFEMTLADAGGLGGGLEALVQLAQKLTEIEAVDEVLYGQGWVENYASLSRVFSLLSIIFLFSMLAGSVFVISSAIKSSVIQRKDEIEIMELFGATKLRIQGPFIFEGLALGFVSGFLALVVSYFVFQWQAQVFQESLGFWNFAAHLEFFSLLRALLFLIVTGLMGAFGSFLCVRGINTGWAAAEGAKK